MEVVTNSGGLILRLLLLARSIRNKTESLSLTLNPSLKKKAKMATKTSSNLQILQKVVQLIPSL